MRLLAIDPSINLVGVAVLIDNKYQTSYTLRTDEDKSVTHKLCDIANHFTEIAYAYDCVIIEMPYTFVREGNRGIKNVRSVQLLSMAIGAIIGSLSVNRKLRIELVSASDWKGHTSKEQTQIQAKFVAGKEVNTHQADAIMMAIKWLSIDKILNLMEQSRNKTKPI